MGVSTGAGTRDVRWEVDSLIYSISLAKVLGLNWAV